MRPVGLLLVLSVSTCSVGLRRLLVGWDGSENLVLSCTGLIYMYNFAGVAMSPWQLRRAL